MATTTLSPLPLAVSNNLMSYNGGTPTYVNFTNNLTVDARIYWIDMTGKRVLYATLGPGETRRQQTYVGHPWEVVVADTGFKADYLPIADESNVILGPDKNVTVKVLHTLTSFPDEVTEGLCSVQGGSATVVNFINHLNVDAKVFWIDYTGQRILYATLRPGETRHQETYVGHPWEVVAEPGFKKVYLPIETESNVILERDLSIKDGKTYNIINVLTGTLIDLSATDGVSVTGSIANGGEYQKWTLESITGNWILKDKGWGRYLGIQSGGIQPGIPLNGSAHAVQWDLRPESTPGTYRILVPGAQHPLHVDLFESRATSGTPVILYPRMDPGLNQIWKFVEG